MFNKVNFQTAPQIHLLMLSICRNCLILFISQVISSLFFEIELIFYYSCVIFKIVGETGQFPLMLWHHLGFWFGIQVSDQLKGHITD